VKAIVARRLGRLRVEDRVLVEAASVLGREFQLEALAALLRVDPSSLAGSLRELATKGIVVEVSGDRHRFAHDHLRAIAYDAIPIDRRSALHRTTALVLEPRVDAPGGVRSAELAYHFKEGRERAKAVTYLEKAVAQAVAMFANREAARLFRDLLELTARDVDAGATLRRARWERGLGDALHGDGQLEESRAHLENALRLLGHAPPAPGRKLGLATAAQLFEQAARRIVPPSACTRAPGTPADLEAAQAYDRLLQIFYYTGAQVEMLHATLKTLNLSERGGPSPELARAYAIAHAVAGVIPFRSLAEAYLENATDILNAAPDPAVESYLLLLTGGYRAGLAEWELAGLAFDRGLSIATGLSFHRRCDEIRLGRGTWTFVRAQFEEAALDTDTDVMVSRRGDPQAHAWRVLLRVQALLALGDVDKAGRLAREAEDRLKDLQRSERLWTFAVLATIALRRRRFDDAYRLATQALEQITAAPPVAFYCVEAYSMVCDVYLSLWERGRSPTGAGRDLPARAASACDALRAFARIFPAAGPRAALHEGTLHHQRGRRAKAQAAWERSLDTAIALRMPYDEAVAGWRLARAMAPGARREERLAGVLRAARALGATPLAERVTEDLGAG
jgi:tetratricopeptide (TPR) repeat protein